MPDALLRWPWRLVAVVLFAALGYVIWRGYQQPELILDFAAMRLC
ncbi:MAG TPA: hypothetical protein VGA51_21215 [Casimicrobiaceae bacterium]